jgi:hypothetical protein
MKARAFMDTLSTAGRLDADCAENRGVYSDKPPVIVERFVNGRWVEKRMEWNGTKYREVSK